MIVRRTRIASLAVLSMLAAAPAVAEDDSGGLRPAARLVMQAIQVDEPAVVIALMDATVAFDLGTAACGKAYQRPGRASGRARAALAACLVELGRGGETGAVPILIDRVPRVEVQTDRGFFTFELRRVKSRLRVSAVQFRTIDDIEDGVEGGVAGGVPGGVAGGVVYGPPREPLPPPPPPPAPPMNISPQAFDAQRIAGEKIILPDDATKIAIGASGKTSFLVPIKICIDVDGKITDVRILKSSGYPAYDQKFDREIRTWRYRPFMVNGAPAPACGMVNFSYRQT